MNEVLYDIPLDTTTLQVAPPFVPKTIIFVNGSNVNVTATDEMGHAVTFGANDGGAIPVWPSRHWSFVSAGGYTTGSAYVYFADKRIPGQVGGLVGASSVVTLGGAIPAGENIIGAVNVVGSTDLNELVVDASGLIGINNYPATQAVSAASGAFVDGSINTIGAQADAAWVSGSGTLVSLLKAIFGRLANVLSLLFNANGELRTAERAAVNVVWGTLTTGGGAVQLVGTRTTRRNVLIVNESANTCRLGNASVAAAAGNGVLLAANQSVVLQGQDAIYGINVSGACVLSYRDEYD